MGRFCNQQLNDLKISSLLSSQHLETQCQSSTDTVPTASPVKQFDRKKYKRLRPRLNYAFFNNIADILNKVYFILSNINTELSLNASISSSLEIDGTILSELEPLIGSGDSSIRRFVFVSIHDEEFENSFLI